MQIVLSDHNCEGQARAIFRALDTGGYLKLMPVELRLFVDVGLSADAEDAVVWQFCQENRFVLLTGNRKTSDGEQSLGCMSCDRRKGLTEEDFKVVEGSTAR